MQQQKTRAARPRQQIDQSLFYPRQHGAMLKTITDKMRYFILIGLLACSTFTFSQTDSSSYYIKQLSWNSFEITTNYVSMLVLKEDAKQIVSISSKHKIDELINCLTNKKKSVVSHVILTQIFEPEAAKFSQIYNYAKDSTIASVQYTYNGLTWNWSKSLGNKINKKDMEAIKKYWLDKKK